MPSTSTLPPPSDDQGPTQRTGHGSSHACPHWSVVWKPLPVSLWTVPHTVPWPGIDVILRAPTWRFLGSCLVSASALVLARPRHQREDERCAEREHDRGEGSEVVHDVSVAPDTEAPVKTSSSGPEDRCDLTRPGSSPRARSGGPASRAAPASQSPGSTHWGSATHLA